jgi:hypothetical protein
MTSRNTTLGTRRAQVDQIIDRYLRLIDSRYPDNLERRTLEQAFVRVANEFSQRHGITRAAWQDVGVSTAVLNRLRLKN